MAQFDPNRPDFTPYGFSCVRWNPSPMRRPDHHNEIELNMLSSGWVTYLLGGRKVRIEAGHLSVFWAAIPHQVIAFGGGTAEYFVATIPFAWFLQCRLPENLRRPILRGEVVSDPQAGRARVDCELFAQWEMDLKASGEGAREIVMLEMEARLRRLSASFPATHGRRPRDRKLTVQSGGLNKVEQLACVIAQRYTEQVTVAELGEAVGLHPNYAMSLFKKSFGTTLIDYLTHHRVSHAQGLLATTDEKIVEIAFSSGFNSISRFNEAFRRACGCSPRDYRNQHRLDD